MGSGKTGESLSANETVIRILKVNTANGQASPQDFELSSSDKLSPIKSISVWANSLTTPQQAREFLGGTSSTCLKYCLISVGRIRSIILSNCDIRIDVVWDNLTGVLPGIEGHCGITGLHRPEMLPREPYKRLRVRLADIANENLHTFE